MKNKKITAKEFAKLTDQQVLERKIELKDIIFDENDEEDRIIKKAYIWGWRGRGYY